MEAKELRINNLFGNLEDESIYKCVAIDSESEMAAGICVNEMGWMAETHNHSIDQVKPIPLDEEWLKRFGFNKHKSLERYSDGFYDVIKDGDQYWLCMGPFKIQMKGADHVHQLQNLIYALTGEELKIKEDE